MRLITTDGAPAGRCPACSTSRLSASFSRRQKHPRDLRVDGTACKGCPGRVRAIAVHGDPQDLLMDDVEVGNGSLIFRQTQGQRSDMQPGDEAEIAERKLRRNTSCH